MSGGGQGLRLSAQEDEPGRRCFGAMATYPAPTCTHPTIYLAWHGQWRRCSVCGAYLHLEGTLMARLRKLVTPRGRGREPRPHHRPVEVRGARPNWFPAGRIVDGSDMEVAEGGKPTDDFHAQLEGGEQRVVRRLDGRSPAGEGEADHRKVA